MPYSKRQFITEALTEIGLGESVHDATPEELTSALRRMDSMMAEWNSKGIRLAYPLFDNPADSELDGSTGVPDSANNAIITNLAIQIAPSYGKIVSRDTKVAAKKGYTNVARSSGVTSPLQKQLPDTMPISAGAKSGRNSRDPFIRKEAAGVESGAEGELDSY